VNEFCDSALLQLVEADVGRVIGLHPEIFFSRPVPGVTEFQKEFFPFRVIHLGTTEPPVAKTGMNMPDQRLGIERMGMHSVTSLFVQ
jgi:hypothetical protein